MALSMAFVTYPREKSFVERVPLSLVVLICPRTTGVTGRSTGWPLGGAVSPLPAGIMRVRPPPRGLKETFDSVTSRDMPRLGENPMPNCVPRIPAVPTGLEISKFDCLFSFLVLTTRSPISKSTNTLEELGSS